MFCDHAFLFLNSMYETSESVPQTCWLNGIWHFWHNLKRTHLVNTAKENKEVKIRVYYWAYTWARSAPSSHSSTSSSKQQVNECRENPQSATSRREDGEKEEEEEEKWICTSKPPGGDLCGRIHLSLSSCLCLSLPRSLMLPFCLALTDLLRGRDQNESPAPSSPHPSLSPLLHQLTASPPSFLPRSPLVPWPEPAFLSPRRKMREIGGWGRRWGGGGDSRRRGWASFFFSPSLWPALKDSFPLSLSHTLVTFFPFLFLSSFQHSVYFQQTSGGDFFIYFFFVGE